MHTFLTAVYTFWGGLIIGWLLRGLLTRGPY